MYQSGASRYVVSDLIQRSRDLEQQIVKGHFSDPSQKEDAVRRLIQFQKKLAEFAEGSTKEQHLARAEQYAQTLATPRPKSAKPRLNGQRKTPAPADEEDGPGLDEEEERFIRAAERMIKRTQVKWEDVAGLEETKRQFISTINLCFSRKPDGLQIGNLDKILFYGPPGTGKTLIASAAAATNDMTFFEVGVSKDLLSKWVGDSPKILQAIYDKAEASAPAIVFLDEATNVLSLNEGKHDVGIQLHDTLLTILDGFGGKEGDRQVITIATTNRPWELTPAMKSRFKRHIYVPLPDLEARTRIFELNTRGHHVDVDLRTLAAGMEGYSGRELKNMCEEAVQRMLRDANPDLESPEFQRGHNLKVMPLTERHFANARSGMVPAVSEEELQEYAAHQEGERI